MVSHRAARPRLGRIAATQGLIVLACERRPGVLQSGLKRLQLIGRERLDRLVVGGAQIALEQLHRGLMCRDLRFIEFPRAAGFRRAVQSSQAIGTSRRGLAGWLHLGTRLSLQLNQRLVSLRRGIGLADGRNSQFLAAAAIGRLNRVLLKEVELIEARNHVWPGGCAYTRVTGIVGKDSMAGEQQNDGKEYAHATPTGCRASGSRNVKDA